jgi:type I restriction enzyme S subunit
MGMQKDIPTLRFPEFGDEWTNEKLGNMTKISSGGTPSRSNSDFWNGSIPWVSTTLIDFNIITRVEEYITIIGLENSSAKLFPTGTVLMAMYVQGKTRGKVAILGIEATTNQACAAVMPDKNFVNELFLFHNLAGRYEEIRNISNQGGQENLSGELLKSILLTFPKISEQQKIATFLTAIDEKLTQLKKKKSLLAQYKKGVMQKIFSQEIRFKDEHGEEFPLWEEKKFGQLYSFITTNSLSREKLNYESGTVKNIHYGDIHTKFNPLFDITTEYVPYINDEIQLAKLKLENYCIKGDLVIADASEDYNDIGKAIEIAIINDEKVVAGLHTILARPNLSKISYAFGAFLMKSDSIHFQIRIISQGAKVLGLSSNKLSNISVILPCLAEQTKIANFLSAIDDKITHCSTQIEKMGLWKKGLMQKMFC